VGLGKGALIVDVGGGIGSQSVTLAKNFPDLKFVIQDRERTLGEAGAVSHSLKFQ
jgi:ubiquinone/menaquinone biosynthesis C-methylase UbiE